MNTSFLHLTSNLGSLFDEQVIEDRWYSELAKVIIQYSPGVVAIHCQEIGGKDFESNMSKVEKFIRNIKGLGCFADYDRFRAYVDTGHACFNSFTALGCFYFIHKSIQSVALWNFNSRSFEEVAPRSELVCTESQDEFPTLSSDQFHFKDRFPNNYFPSVRWSRKGLLHTKWRINSLVVNMVNIHLFHDEDNLVALEQSPSTYSQYRQKALHHTIEHLSKNVQGLSPEANFIFGDFNFRLDLSSVVKHLTSSTYHPQFIRGEEGGLLKVLYRNSLSSDDSDNLCIERRKFFLNSHARLFKEKFKQLTQFDNELKSYQGLNELPINFPPSYPFSEDITKGSDYMDKRCPAWCDRILLNRTAMDLIEKSTIPPVYDMMSKTICVGDHKPIFLVFSVDSSSPLRSTKDDPATHHSEDL